MRSEAAAFLGAQQWPEGDGAFVMSRDDLRTLLERAFGAGYASGRISRAVVKPGDET